MAQLGFNAEGVERTGTYEPLPAGDYPVMVVASTMKHPKGPYGEDTSKPAYLELSIDIIEGEYKGRKLTDRLHLNNPSDMTRKIAKGTLASICDALGVGGVNDSYELHNKPMLAKVAIKPASGQYGPSNEVKGYKAMGAATAKAPATPAKTNPWD